MLHRTFCKIWSSLLKVQWFTPWTRFRLLMELFLFHDPLFRICSPSSMTILLGSRISPATQSIPKLEALVIRLLSGSGCGTSAPRLTPMDPYWKRMGRNAALHKILMRQCFLRGSFGLKGLFFGSLLLECDLLAKKVPGGTPYSQHIMIRNWT